MLFRDGPAVTVVFVALPERKTAGNILCMLVLVEFLSRVEDWKSWKSAAFSEGYQQTLL